MNYKEFKAYFSERKNLPIIESIECLCDETDNIELFEHMEHVATLAEELAKHYNLNEDEAYLTGFLHDVARLIDPEEYIQILENHDVYVTDDEMKVIDVLHGKVAKVLCENVLDVQSADIHSGILYHTTLRKKATDFEKVIFLADKMTWTYDDMVFNIEETVFQSLNVACYNALSWIIKHLENKNGLILPDTLEAYLFYKSSVLF